VTVNDWSNKTIGELCSFSNGYGFRPPDWSKEGLPIIRIQNLNGSKEFNYFKGIPDESWLVEPGTILFAWAGTRGVSFGPTIWSGPRGVLNQHIYRIHPYKGVNPLWLYAALEIATKNIEQSAHGFKATLLHVRKEEITSQVLHFPPPCEQQKIVTVLSNIDSLINSLDAFIAKKRDIKQATMQQLLTGKTRLPGFSGKWEIKKLGEIAYINMGQSPDSKNYNIKGIGIALIQGNADIENRKSISRVWTTQISKTCNAGDLIMTVRAPVGTIGIATKESCLGRGVCSLKPISDNKDFIFHSMVFLEDKWKLIGQGSTFDSANSSQIAEFPLLLTASVGEQQAIATILSDMDAEIAALEQKRDKTRALKQGIMQELLTGKTRLL